MPTFRADLAAIAPYKPGKPIEEVAREFGLERIAKLASNESPLPPFPAVQDAIAAAIPSLHRYPDNYRYDLRMALAAHLDVPPDHLWFGGGSNELMLMTAIAVGGPGTSAVYAWPSFGLYRIGTQVAMAQRVEVPLDGAHRHDLDAMLAAIRPDTTVVYVCNPNNPTGTHVPAGALYDFVAQVPERVLVVVDEAYFEFATAADFGTALPLALAQDNVLVARTFSKVYGLAGIRCGYMVGAHATLEELRRVQLPFTTNALAQVGATEALRHQDDVADRVQRNAERLKLFAEELADRGIAFADSQTNFVYLHPGGDDAQEFKRALLPHGVIVRPFEHGWVRVSVGSDDENRAFFTALDAVRA